VYTKEIKKLNKIFTASLTLKKGVLDFFPLSNSWKKTFSNVNKKNQL
jgi:hypothetical protein